MLETIEGFIHSNNYRSRLHIRFLKSCEHWGDVNIVHDILPVLFIGGCFPRGNASDQLVVSLVVCVSIA